MEAYELNCLVRALVTAELNISQSHLGDYFKNILERGALYKLPTGRLLFLFSFPLLLEEPKTLKVLVISISEPR